MLRDIYASLDVAWLCYYLFIHTKVFFPALYCKIFGYWEAYESKHIAPLLEVVLCADLPRCHIL